jgi:protease-4
MQEASLAGALAALAMLSGGPAQAQPPATELAPEIPDGVERLSHDISASGSASSLDLNPALLRDAGRYHLQVLGYFGSDSARLRSGVGAFASLSLFDALSLGLGLSRLTTPNSADRPSSGSALPYSLTRASFGLALGSPKSLSLGVAFHRIFADGRVARRSEVELGLVARMTRFASFGVVGGLSPIHQTPELGLPAQGRVGGELSLRPFGNDWLEFAGQLRLFTQSSTRFRIDDSTLYPRFRLAARHKHARIFGELENIPTAVLAFNESRLDGNLWRGSIGLEWLLGGLQVGTGLHIGTSLQSPGAAISLGLGGREADDEVVARGNVPYVLRTSTLARASDLAKILLALDARRELGPRNNILLVFDEPSLSWATAFELRQALAYLVAARGRVSAYLVEANLATYYLASVAQKVAIHPTGHLDLSGLQSERLYFGEALQRLGVEATSIHTGDYKSANDKWTRADRSPGDREQMSALLATAHEAFVREISIARKIDATDLRGKWAQTSIGAQQAKSAGFVDEITYLDELRDPDDPNFEDVSARSRPAPQHFTGTPYVAVLVLDGTIMDGQSLDVPLLGISRLGPETVAKELRKLTADRNCKAIVVRVESPGGSVSASEDLWHLFQRAQSEHESDPDSTPALYVSMANIAGSGGYYLSAAIPDIWASPLTITGSIGVTTVHFDASKLLDKLGIHADQMIFGQPSDRPSHYLPLDASSHQRLRTRIEELYALFIRRVAEGRNIDPARVRALAGGRVYTGNEAYRLGLVSHLGTLNDAVRCARAQATRRRADAPEIVVIEPKMGLLMGLLGSASARAQHRSTQSLLAWAQDIAHAMPTLRPWLGEALSYVWLGSDRPLALTTTWDPPPTRSK